MTSIFFGYKTYLAMSDDRIITAVEMTPGGEPDGKHLPTLIDKAEQNGLEVKEIIGNMAYISKQNLDVCEEKEMILYAKTNPAVAAAADRAPEDGFSINKDAGMLQCPAGELATRKEKRTARNGNTYTIAVHNIMSNNRPPQTNDGSQAA